ncbi:unnamed protein product, partial [Didymodactylos carnosus]
MSTIEKSIQWINIFKKEWIEGNVKNIILRKKLIEKIVELELILENGVRDLEEQQKRSQLLVEGNETNEKKPSTSSITISTTKARADKRKYRSSRSTRNRKEKYSKSKIIKNQTNSETFTEDCVIRIKRIPDALAESSFPVINTTDPTIHRQSTQPSKNGSSRISEETRKKKLKSTTKSDTSNYNTVKLKPKQKQRIENKSPVKSPLSLTGNQSQEAHLAKGVKKAKTHSRKLLCSHSRIADDMLGCSTNQTGETERFIGPNGILKNGRKLSDMSLIEPEKSVIVISSNVIDEMPTLSEKEKDQKNDVSPSTVTTTSSDGVDLEGELSDAHLKKNNQISISVHGQSRKRSNDGKIKKQIEKDLDIGETNVKVDEQEEHVDISDDDDNSDTQRLKRAKTTEDDVNEKRIDEESTHSFDELLAKMIAEQQPQIPSSTEQDNQLERGENHSEALLVPTTMINSLSTSSYLAMKDGEILTTLSQFNTYLPDNIVPDYDGNKEDNLIDASVLYVYLENENEPVAKKRRRNSDGDSSPIKRKPIRGLARKQLTVSSTSDDDDDDDDNNNKNNILENNKLLNKKKRVVVKRSSPSSDSESSDNKKQRLRKGTMDNERRSVLKLTHKKSTPKKKIKIANDVINLDTATIHVQENSINDNNDETTSENENNDDKDDDDELSTKKGRKNIRKIIKDKQLQERTKSAVEAEKERRRRIEQKQKEYNKILLNQSGYLEQNKDNMNKKLILEMNKETNESLIELDRKLVQSMKQHQLEGVQFLWNNLFESLAAINDKRHKTHHGNGALLAHCMGLGKTLQVISFIHTLFKHETLTHVRTCVILCPINAALNWSTEFEHWLENIEPKINVYQITSMKLNARIPQLNYWMENGGVVIMGYEMYRRLATGIGIRKKQSKLKAYECLVDPGPDIIVCDEGHILKNSQTALAKVVNQVKTSRRIVLTGTPLQNNLIEYFCMVNFIKPNLLGTQQEFVNRFVNPIQNGQHRDSSMDDVKIMKRRACVLHDLLTGCIDRRDYSLLKTYLPPKFEYIITIRMCDLQQTLYEMYLKREIDEQSTSAVSKKNFQSTKLFADYQYLMKIWTHPFILRPHFIDQYRRRLMNDLFEDDEEEPEAIFTDEEVEENGRKRKKKKSSKKQTDDIEEIEYFDTDITTDNQGFMIDNINDSVETHSNNKSVTNVNSKQKKRKRSSSTTTSISSLSTTSSDIGEIDLQNINNNQESDENSGDEIVVRRTTRSRATIENKSATKKRSTMMNIKNSDIFDTGVDDDTIVIDPEMNGSGTDVDEKTEQEKEIDPWMNEMREQWWFPFVEDNNDEFNLQLSGKMTLLKSILEKCYDIGDKILLFSRSLYTLNYIEKFLKHIHMENEKIYNEKLDKRQQLIKLLENNNNTEMERRQNENCTTTTITTGIGRILEDIPESIQWIKDNDYFRMDGSTDVQLRKRYASLFNDETNSRARLFLISTLAGGIGINLVGSNRVIVFDASWNPSVDIQAIFRSYRFGQTKPVYIYRFLAHGTMEEKIYQRQVVKQSLSQRVIDDHQLTRHFSEADIKELYNFTPESLPPVKSEQEIKNDVNFPLPKDHLLTDLLYEHNQW